MILCNIEFSNFKIAHRPLAPRTPPSHIPHTLPSHIRPLVASSNAETTRSAAGSTGSEQRRCASRGINVEASGPVGNEQGQPNDSVGWGQG
jgi:hypothetical protein